MIFNIFKFKSIVSWSMILTYCLNTNLFSKDIEVVSKYCKINWTKNYIECKGISAEGQNKYNAIRSAEIIAKKNILEFVQGIKITSDLDIRGAMAAHHVIQERINGTIIGARIISSIHNKTDKHGEAVVRLNIGSDVLKSILDNPKIDIVNKKSNFSFFTQLHADSNYYSSDLETMKKIYSDLKDKDYNKSSILIYIDNLIGNVENSKETGIIIDATAVSEFEIAAIPKIRDEKGNELYPKNVVTKSTIVKKNGAVCYEAVLKDAQKNRRVSANPFIIKAKSIYGKKSSDLVIDAKDKNQFIQNKELLKNAKVLILVGI